MSTVFCCSSAFGAPAITTVANAASNIGFNYPIAQGAIFVLYGTGLGPANLTLAPAAFQSTTLSGTSVSVTVGSTTVNALLYYTSATQVAALLPSNTPTGSANFTVTYNGQTSAPIAHGVGPSDIGIFTVDSSGQGAAIITYADYSLVSPVKAANCGGPNTTCGAANPGDTLILWGTGLGPVNGSDAAGAGLGQPVANAQITLWLGGVQAPLVYAGRSGCCIGEDQIVFTVPNNVPTGCSVPITIQSATTSSNTGFIAVANGSRNCTAVNAALGAVSAAAFEQLISGANPVNVASLDIGHWPTGNGAGYEDQAQFQFFKITSWTPGTQPFALTDLDDQPVGTCLVYSNTNANNDVPITNGADLSAGSSFIVNGPAGTVSVPQTPLSTGGNTSLSATGAFLAPGNFTITGPGGADIGAFTANFTVGAVPSLLAPANNATVTRANGLTVTWTPVASGNLWIQVVSAADPNFNNGFTTQCVAPASAGAFTIPAYALLPLIPGSPAYVQLISNNTFPFTASGANYAAVTVQVASQSPSIVLK